MATLSLPGSRSQGRRSRSARSPAPSLHSFAHAVQFYEREDFLCGAIAEYFKAGIEAGEPLIVIANESHRQRLCHVIEGMGFDLGRTRGSGQLTLLDAEALLDRVIVAGMPNRNWFRSALTGIFEQTRPGGHHTRRLRVYGELVDVLWKSGNDGGALAIEELWNELGRDQSFSLLCGYFIGNFHDETHGALFQQLCGTHTHVVPTEVYSKKGGSDARMREVSMLQQRARALESEVEHRRQLEGELRTALEARKRLEAKLRRQNEDLSRTVRFSELFVGILGHDLRNPLSAITTAASLLERRAESEKVAKPAARILNSAVRMGRMIDQILDFTRIRLGKGIPLEPRPTDLAAVCRVVVDEFDALGQSGRVRLDLIGDVVGQWDVDRLLQLLSNLLSNGLAHGTPGRPVTLRIDGGDAAAVSIDVHNVGCIPDDLLPEIFEPFRCGDMNGKQEGANGLGLGLFISQQIVLAHGGQIDVTSLDTSGTTFRVRLPRCVQRPEPAFVKVGAPS